MDIITDEGIILNSLRYGDSSKILKVFSKDYGKISLIAKGAYSKKNKFGASIEPTTISNLTYYHKANRELQQLTESNFIYKYKNLFNDIYRIATSYIILEILDFTLSKEQTNIKAYNLAVKFLKSNDDINRNTYLNLLEFLFRYIEVVGYKFNLDKINYNLQLYFQKYEFNEENLSKKVTISLEDLTPIKNNYDINVKSIKLSLKLLTFIQKIEEVIEIDMREGGSSKNSDYLSTNINDNINEKIIFNIHENSNENSNQVTNLELDELKSELENLLDNSLFHELINFFIEYFSYHFDKKLSLKSLKLLNY